MSGVDMVRVGMEDAIYVHPHRDRILETSAEAVKMIAEAAALLGRDIATPDEARAILGISPAETGAERNAIAE
jgi:3-keto-5-aminohexanoate cleavage enzyme